MSNSTFTTVVVDATTAATLPPVVAVTIPAGNASQSLPDKAVLDELEHLQSNINTLTTMTIVLCVVLLFFFVVQALAVVIQLIRRCGKKNMEEEAEKSKKSRKTSKKSSKSSKKSKKSKKGKTKKGKSKKSKKSASSKSKSKSTSKSSKKSAGAKKKSGFKLPTSKGSGSEKKSETSGAKKSAELSGQKKSAETVSSNKQAPSLIKLQPQDPLLSVSSSKFSGEKTSTPGQVEKEIKLMNVLEAGKLKALPLPPVIAAAIDPKIPEAKTPPLPPKAADSAKDMIEENSAKRFEKEFPDVSTPPQFGTPTEAEKKTQIQLPGTLGHAEAVRKDADVSSPPPLMAEPKAKNDSLMLPVTTPAMAPADPAASVRSAAALPPPGSIQPLPTIPTAPTKLDDLPTKL